MYFIRENFQNLRQMCKLALWIRPQIPTVFSTSGDSVLSRLENWIICVTSLTVMNFQVRHRHVHRGQHRLRQLREPLGRSSLHGPAFLQYTFGPKRKLKKQFLPFIGRRGLHEKVLWHWGPRPYYWPILTDVTWPGNWSYDDHAYLRDYLGGFEVKLCLHIHLKIKHFEIISITLKFNFDLRFLWSWHSWAFGTATFTVLRPTHSFPMINIFTDSQHTSNRETWSQTESKDSFFGALW